MMLANDLKTYYDEVRRYLDCPKDEQDRLLLSVNKQVIELQVDNPNLDYDGIVEFLGEPESLAASLIECLSPDVIQVYHKKKKRKHARLVACIVVVSLRCPSHLYVLFLQSLKQNLLKVISSLSQIINECFCK